MATESLADIEVTGSWQDVVDTHASVASADVQIQNLDNDLVFVVFGGGSEPSGVSGTVLDTLDTVRGNAANVWVRGSGHISVTKL